MDVLAWEECEDGLDGTGCCRSLPYSVNPNNDTAEAHPPIMGSLTSICT